MKLSIITVNYNNRDGLQKTIDSVISQTWRDFEWIIIDGGSTDGSKELLEKYQSNFAYWCSEPDKGVYNAMNKGIAKAKGEYLSFMNSGDCFYEKSTLEKVFSLERTADILYGGWEITTDGCIEFANFKLPIELYSLYRHNICHQAMFIRKMILKDGFDESFPIAADYLRWNQAILEGATFESINIPICKYDGAGISSNMELTAKEMERVRNSFPIGLCISMKHLDEYECSRPIQRTKALIEKGGMLEFITRVLLKTLDKLFLRINFSD